MIEGITRRTPVTETEIQKAVGTKDDVPAVVIGVWLFNAQDDLFSALKSLSLFKVNPYS